MALWPFTNESMSEFAASSLARPLTLVSDGLPCLAAMAAHAGVHDRNVTGGGAVAAKHPKFKAVNTILGNLKTALRGAYKAFDFGKYGHRYLAKFQYRFNRRFHLAAMLHRLAIAVVRCKPCPERVIRAAEIAAQSGRPLPRHVCRAALQYQRAWTNRRASADKVVHHQSPGETA